jgi:hypothetical protein
MKTTIAVAVMVASLSAGATADFLTRDNGQVVTIPDGYNAGPYHKTYNTRGMSDAGTFPGKPWIDAFIFRLSLVDFPSAEDCEPKLVLGTTIPDPRCRVYED